MPRGSSYQSCIMVSFVRRYHPRNLCITPLLLFMFAGVVLMSIAKVEAHAVDNGTRNVVNAFQSCTFVNATLTNETMLLIMECKSPNLSGFVLDHNGTQSVIFDGAQSPSIILGPTDSEELVSFIKWTAVTTSFVALWATLALSFFRSCLNICCPHHLRGPNR